ncbi:MAG: phosphate signaling complex protein PhoU [Candidatus Eiseniibacteriota bacterium]
MERHFDEELNELKTRLLLMGGHAESVIHKAIDALKTRDSGLAEEIFQDDRMIDQLEIEIDDRCIRLLALRQPVGSDLRFITSALKICNDLERVGDHAVNIAQSAVKLNREPELKPLVDIPRMATISTRMLTESLDAFVRNDAASARTILTEDDEVDHLKSQIFGELLSFMCENPSTVTRALELILVSRNLERVADLATNIAEEVVYIAEARVVKHHMEERTAP